MEVMWSDHISDWLHRTYSCACILLVKFKSFVKKRRSVVDRMQSFSVRHQLQLDGVPLYGLACVTTEHLIKKSVKISENQVWYFCTNCQYHQTIAIISSFHLRLNILMMQIDSL